MKVSAFLLILTLLVVPGGGARGEQPATEADREIARQIARADELFEKGQIPEAKHICESLLRTLPPNPSVLLAGVLNVTSKISASEGDYDRAIASAQRAAEVFAAVGDAAGEAHALNNKGIAEIQTAAYEVAERDLEKALELTKTANDVENQVQVLNNLGSARYFRGSYTEAMGGYEKALNLVNANHSSPWSDYWRQITRFNQATLFQRLGRYDQALHIYREVEESSTNLTGGDRAHLYANLGTLYRRLGDPYKALDSYRTAQQLYSRQHDADGEIAVLKNIGIAYALDLEDLNHAANIFRSALALAKQTHNRREEMQAHLYLGETLLRSKTPAAARVEFEQSHALADELSTTEEQWKSLYGLGNVMATSGDFAGAEREYREAISVIERSRSQLQLSPLRTDFFADKREAYDALISILFGKNDLNEAFLFLEKSRARNFQDRISADRNSSPATPTLIQVQARLLPATALLEFWTSEDRIGLIWCTRDAAGMTLKRLTSREQSRIQSLMRSIPHSLGGDGSALDAILPEVWPIPLAVKHLQIVPDAWISYVPFDLLHINDMSRAKLIERYDISDLPSAILLGRGNSNNSSRWPWTKEFVAFADPVMAPAPSEGRQLDPLGDAPQRLLFSAKEVADISHLLPGASRLFLQGEDLKKNFLDGTANSAPILHVSTHAFADGDSPENSRLLFSAQSAYSSDSYLYLRELYGLDLSNVRLATISACDTERGKIIRGEGVQAFSRALLSAGAGSSLTTLWRVDDQPTAEFMRQFYFYLGKENKPKAEALRLAKLKFLHSNSRLNDPSVWAAFVLSGDGLTPIPRVLSWAELALWTALSVSLLVFVSLSARRLRS